MALLDRLGATRDARPAPPAQEAPPPQVPVVLAGVGVAIALGGYIFVQSGQVPGLLFVIGLALGLVLFNSRFGFTSAWRQLVAVRQGKALRAHMLMLATACILFAPILANQVSFKDVPVAASLAPIGWGLFVGAFLFGVGMQLGGSCASGTLFAIGSGQSAILLTLVGFIGGATLGAYHLPWWNELPAHEPVSLTQFGGYPGALAISLAVMAAITALTYAIGRSSAAAARGAAGRPRCRRASSAARGRCGSARCCWPGSTPSRCSSPAAPGASPSPSRSGAPRSWTSSAWTCSRGASGRTRRTSPSSTPASSSRRPRSWTSASSSAP